MEYRRFYDAQGKLQCVVNMEMISTAVPMEDGRTRISIDGQTMDVDSAQFEKALNGAEEPGDALSPSIGRLIQALDRLSFRIPTSIRMHL